MEPVDDRVAAEDLGGHRREQAQDRKFGDGQRDLRAVPGGAPAVEVEGQAAVAEHAPLLDLRRAGGGSAQDRHDARHHLARGEGLHDIIVGAEFDAEHAVDFVVAAGQEQDRRVAATILGAAQAAADLQPVHPRHVDVEDDEVGLVRLRHRKARLAVRRLDR
ncbi:hypothetical protein WR25_02234 [Diploscapter pachys]|uniref:Uncharacterized protein n=1 Tax=Diploscapter pachys TaxID=2018661 RepID=A0A2A2M2L6_9BILA|nr:hypothetical protein WR25_02234 [Diploscapter pachys]